MLIKTRRRTDTEARTSTEIAGRLSVVSSEHPSGVTQSNIRAADEIRSIAGRIPLEIWENILQNLCPSQLQEVSLASRHFNTVVKSLELWTRISTTANLGPTKTRGKKKTHYGLVMANRHRICEGCFKFCKHFRAYDMPLPVFLNSQGKNVQLCLECRCAYFSENPEMDGTKAQSFCRKLYGGQVGVDAQNNYVLAFEKRRLERKGLRADNDARLTGGSVEMRQG